MKTAYNKEILNIVKEFEYFREAPIDVFVEDIKEIIHHIQIITIDHVVKYCANNAEICSLGKGRSHEYIVDKQSILNIATKLKSEL